MPSQTKEPELAWLGTKRFWAIAAGVLLFLLLVLFVRHRRISSPEALVPVVTLSGPARAEHGKTARYAVLVRDRFGAPIPRASVRVGFWRTGFLELAHATTGEGGDAAVEVRFPDDFTQRRSLVAVADAGVTEGFDDLLVDPRTAGNPTVFVSTDKPMYQPGQTVHVRALAMADDLPIAEKKTVVEIRTPDGIKVFREEKATSAFGVVAHDFALADQVKLGRYTITLSGDGGAFGTRSFEVKRYALPKLKVAFDDVETFTPNKPLRGAARASWIFGEPVTAGTITVTLERYGSLVQRVRGPVDKSGAFRFELFANASANEKHPGGYALRAHVDVEGGLQADATREVTAMGASAIQLEAFPESGPLVLDVAQDVFVVTTHAAPGPVTVRAMPDGPEATTSERGIATLRVRPTKGRKLEIVAHADDGSTGKLEITPEVDRLVVRPDRTAYDAGQTVHAAVLGAEPGDHVALQMSKGTEPIATGSCVVRSADAGCDAALTIPAGVSGLAWVHAVSLPVGKREVRAGQRLVVIGGGSRDLDLKITPDKAVYAPRDVGAIDVAVKGAGGAPVKAQLGIAAADEAVFALADVRPDLEKKFFTVDRDLGEARGSYGSYGAFGYFAEHALPPALEAAKAYDASTADDVRATILAALGTMPAAGGLPDASSVRVAQRANDAVARGKAKTFAWTVVLLAAAALAAFAAFAAYGWIRWRSPVLLALDDDRLRHELAALWVDYLVAVVGPPVLTAIGAIFAGSALDGSVSKEAFCGQWAMLGAFSAVLLARAVRRLRRVPITADAPLLRRIPFFLPAAAFLGHAAIVGVLFDQGVRLELLFAVRVDALFIPLLVTGAAQIAFGFLATLRRTLQRETTRLQRVWLLVSRASFLGLPITLVGLLVVVALHVKEARAVSWDDFRNVRETEYAPASVLASKEGGTGTRAKAEEGTMGSPAAPAHAALAGRYGVEAPQAQAGDEKKADAPPQAKPIVRDYFPETLLWAPEVITDDAGHARIEVPFADSITTWRFGVRAVSRAGQLGSATVPLVVKQDFFVDAALPPLLTQGDEIAVPVTVFGYMDGEQDVALAIEGDGITTVGQASTQVHLGRRDMRGVRFVVRAEKAGERVVRVKASSAARSDTIERKVTVMPNGVAVVRTRNGRLQGAATVDVELPEGAVDGGNDLALKVYGGPLSQLGEGLDGIFQLPHGCFEQTSSTTYPSILALHFLRRTKAPSPEVERKAKAYIVDGYQRLVSFEVPGGGFSAFGDAPASTTLTAYGLLELAEMADVATVDEQLVARTRTWLFAQRTPNGGWTKDGHKETVDDVLVTSYAAWALASQPDPRLGAVLDWVAHASGPQAEDPYGLALRANALVAGGRANDAKPILERLAAAAIRDEEGVHWTSHESGVMYSYGASLDVEVTGLAAHALAAAQIEPDLRAGALDWLVAKKGPYGTWSTTQATIAAMRALIDEARPASKDPQDVTILVDGEKVDAHRLEPANRDVHRLIGLRRFATTGKHAIELRATGTGDVSYQLVATHYLPRAQRPPTPIALDVTYAPSAVPAGSTMSCHVRVAWRGKEPAMMPLVEIGVPPGFEVETEGLDARVRRWTLERGKLTLYFTSLAEDKPLAIDVRMRAQRSARVLAPASAAYLYYQPEIRTETAPVLVRSL